MDKRIKKHAEILCNWCTEISEGENILITAGNEAEELIKALYEEIGKKKANPITLLVDVESNRKYFTNYEGEFETPKHLKSLYEETDVFIEIKSENNLRAFNNVSDRKIADYHRALKPIQGLVEEKRWVLTQHPTSAQAQVAEMSLEEYKDFVYNTILVDWKEIHKKQEKLAKKLDEGKKVHITGPKTELEMSIEGAKPKNSDGKTNMPSGEVFTAPVVDSVEGEILFDLPVIFQGKEIEDVYLNFEGGEIVDFSAEKGEDYLNEILNVDEGSNKVGELGIGTNRGINQFTKNILFDEKLGDTIHLALGRALKETVGEDQERNNSAIHVDMIKSMKEGKLEIDGMEVLAEGKFFWEM